LQRRSAADAGPDTFRAAVAAANANAAVDTIEFDGALAVTLTSAVVYTGAQALTILGAGSALSGDGSMDPTWDGGLFVSRSGASITIEDLSFQDSFNNGVGVFIPASGGPVVVTLTRVTIQGSRFHGLYVDDQLTAAFFTGDELHLACVDPWPFQSSASVELAVRDSSILGNGVVVHDGAAPDFDDSLATGCPVDFDGIRIDEGGNGGIRATIAGAAAIGNRADGIELDERDNGNVDAWVVDSSIDDNGDTGTDDTDDGFDIDEFGNGDIGAHFEQVTVNGNFDEGLDVSEADNGNASVTLVGSDFSANEDEGIKVDELLGGNVQVAIAQSTVNESASQQGIEILESGNGNLQFDIERSDVRENDNDGIALTEESQGSLQAFLLLTEVMENGDHAVTAEQESPGAGALVATTSDLTGNDDTSLDLTGVSATLTATPIDP
jgi:hypothetical protein